MICCFDATSKTRFCICFKMDKMSGSFNDSSSLIEKQEDFPVVFEEFLDQKGNEELGAVDGSCSTLVAAGLEDPASWWQPVVMTT